MHRVFLDNVINDALPMSPEVLTQVSLSCSVWAFLPVSFLWVPLFSSATRTAHLLYDYGQKGAHAREHTNETSPRLPLQMDVLYNFSESTNVEIGYRWFLLNLRNRNKVRDLSERA